MQFALQACLRGSLSQVHHYGGNRKRTRIESTCEIIVIKAHSQEKAVAKVIGIWVRSILAISSHHPFGLVPNVVVEHTECS